MPVAKGGDSKQALVVTLVFFILLSIILGIFTYMGYSDSDKYQKEKATAENAEKTAKSERDANRSVALLYRTYLGYQPNDKGELKVAYDDAAKATGKDDTAKVLQELEKELGWDKTKGLPNTDMKRKIADLENQKKDALTQLAQTKEELDKRMAELKKAREQRDAFEVEFKKKLDEVNAQRTADLKKYEESLQQQQQGFGDQSKEVVRLKEEMENLEKGLRKQIDALKKENKAQQVQVEKLQDKKPKYTASSDQPKGKIVLMDRTGKLPYINLGSADRVRPQLTFSIHALGADGRPKPASKGSLEVIHVVNEHLSQCKVTDQRDEIRDPIVTGDVLLNPGWDPNQQRHVAIAGIVDLTGDVHRDRPAEAKRAVEDFIRTLENQNMVVDAWLDVADNSVKGKGITRETDYLVLGYLPETKAGAIREDDPKAKQRDDINKLATKMQDEATKLGVPIIKLRDFLAITGFKPPRGREEDKLGQIHSSLPASGSPIEKSVSKPKVNEEKKDENK